jgi:general stress protein YciG
MPKNSKPMTVAEAGKKGGRARAKKYSHEQLSMWARKGGRPPKKEAKQ